MLTTNLTLKEKAHYGVPFTNDEQIEILYSLELLEAIQDTHGIESAKDIQDAIDNAVNQERENFNMILETIADKLLNIDLIDHAYLAEKQLDNLLKQIEGWRDNLT